MTMTTDKQNKVLNVPNLRFPEFTGEWEKYKVCDVLDFYSTNSLSWEQLDFETDRLLNLHYGLIHVGLPTLVDLKTELLPGIKEGNVPKNYELCKSGDVAFADASEDTNDVAKAVEFIDTNEKSVVCGLHTIHGRDNKDLTVIGYKGCAFASPAFHNQIRRIAQGTKIFSINSKNFSECTIGIPTKAEQKKIVKLLSLIDERIATQSRIIEDLEKLMSAISIYIFENISAPTIPLSYFIKKGKAGGTPTSTNKDYYGGDIPFLSINDITEQGKYINYTEKTLTPAGIENSAAWIVPKHSVIFSMYASVGLVTINAVSLATSQAMFAMILKNPELTDFLYYFLSYFRYRHIYKYLETGAQSNINAEIVRSIPVPNLGVNNCIKIGKTLSLIDDKLSVERTTLRLLLAQKQFLLQKLFI